MSADAARNARDIPSHAEVGTVGERGDLIISWGPRLGIWAWSFVGVLALATLVAVGAVRGVTNQTGEISGLSRSVSSLGSPLGAAIAGTILVAGITSTPERSSALAMATLAVIGLFGLVAARLPPTRLVPRTFQDPSTDVGRPR